MENLSEEQTNSKHKIGAFICRWGVNIGGILDVPKIVEEIDKQILEDASKIYGTK